MSKWVGVVQIDMQTRRRIGDAVVNIDNVYCLCCADDTVHFVDGWIIKVNPESMKTLLEEIKGETE